MRATSTPSNLTPKAAARSRLRRGDMSLVDPADACRRAIAAVQELHCFLQTWYRGEGSESASSALARLHAALHPSLQLVDPEGVTFDRGGMLALIVPYRGCYPDLRIIVRSCQTELQNGLVLATYVEEQYEGGTRDKRRCTAVLKPDSEAPDGCMWLRIHETRMPPAGMD
jgi:hypothetical protein